MKSPEILFVISKNLQFKMVIILECEFMEEIEEENISVPGNELVDKRTFIQSLIVI